MTPAIAQIINQMAVHDGTLRTQITPVRGSAKNGFETVLGSARPEQVHPQAGSSNQPRAGQANVITDIKGGPAQTGPMLAEILGQHGPGMSHTADEKGINQYILQLLLQGMLV